MIVGLYSLNNIRCGGNHVRTLVICGKPYVIKRLHIKRVCHGNLNDILFFNIERDDDMLSCKFFWYKFNCLRFYHCGMDVKKWYVKLVCNSLGNIQFCGKPLFNEQSAQPLPLFLFFI